MECRRCGNVREKALRSRPTSREAILHWRLRRGVPLHGYTQIDTDGVPQVRVPDNPIQANSRTTGNRQLRTAVDSALHLLRVQIPLMHTWEEGGGQADQREECADVEDELNAGVVCQGT